jgi:hypothetical protein
MSIIREWMALMSGTSEGHAWPIVAIASMRWLVGAMSSCPSIESELIEGLRLGAV